MSKVLRCSFSALMVLVLCWPALAQPGANANKAAVENPAQGITQKQADAILEELRQIRQLLAANIAAARAPQPAAQPAPPQNAKVNITGLSVLGSKDAPLTMVEFSDYQCPFCRAFHSSTYEDIKKNWIDTGKLRFVSWDLPLEFHSNAAGAAKAARCASEQNRFWEMRALLISNAAKLEPEAVLAYAGQVPQLDVGRFKTCVQSERYADAIKKSVSEANTQGISGTPSFLIGKTNGDVVDGQVLIGAQPFAAFDKQLKEQLPK
jgi:protein-disulfide isomerase